MSWSLPTCLSDIISYQFLANHTLDTLDYSLPLKVIHISGICSCSFLHLDRSPSGISTTSSFASWAQSFNVTTLAKAIYSEVISYLLTAIRSYLFNLFIFTRCLLKTYSFPGTDLSMEHVLIHLLNPSNNPVRGKLLLLLFCFLSYSYYRRRNWCLKRLNKVFKATLVKRREVVIQTLGSLTPEVMFWTLPVHFSTEPRSINYRSIKEIRNPTERYTFIIG